MLTVDTMLCLTSKNVFPQSHVIFSFFLFLVLVFTYCKQSNKFSSSKITKMKLNDEKTNQIPVEIFQKSLSSVH